MSAGAGDIVSVSGLAIVAALVFGWGTLSARLERFDVTALITLVAAWAAPARSSGGILITGAARRQVVDPAPPAAMPERPGRPRTRLPAQPGMGYSR
jgi:hypothetical protein